MALLVPNEGEVVMVQAILDLDLDLHLFKNDHTPAETDTVADYTEADFTGYVLENLISGNWVITPGAPAVGNYPDVVFTSTASQSQFVYGYYITKRVTGELMWAERFDDNDPAAPYEMVNNGDTITFPPRFTLKDEQD
jgi:hypothetical protein